MKIDWRFLLLLILASAAAYLVGGYAFNRLFLILLALLIFALIQCLILHRQVKFNRKPYPARIRVGQSLGIDLRIYNNAFFAAPLVVAQMLPENRRQAFALGSDEEVLFKKTALPDLRGHLPMGTCRMEVSDLLNIVTLTKTVDLPTVGVYPAIIPSPVTDLLLAAMGSGQTSRLQAPEDPYEIRDLRSYQPGDSLKKINWKVSARQGDLFVRRGDPKEDRRISLVLDFHESILAQGRHFENALVTDLLALSRDLLKRNLAHDLFINDGQASRFNIEKDRDYEPLEEYLLDHKATGKEPLYRFIQNYGDSLRHLGAVVIFTLPKQENLTASEHLISASNRIILLMPGLSASGLTSRRGGLILKELKGAAYAMD